MRSLDVKDCTHRLLQLRLLQGQARLVFQRLTLLLIGFVITSIGCEDPVQQSQSVQNDLGAQEEPTDQRECIPDCEERSCGVDPRCGISCGICGEEQECQSAQCVPKMSDERPSSGGSEANGGVESNGGTDESNDCIETCENTSAECGTLCGTNCGTCNPEENCLENRCVCVPQCAGKLCGADDGCGGSCSPCPRSQSCENCALQLTLLESNETNGQVTSVRIGLSLNLPDGVPHPQIADLHLMMTGPAVLGRVGLGAAIINANKQLVPDPATGMPFRVNGNIYSFMVLSTQNTNEIASGEWLILDLQLGDTGSEPVQVKVVEREQTFAPPPADLQLWGNSQGDGLVIWPALSQGE